MATRLSSSCIIAVLDGRDVVYIARETYVKFDHHFVHVGARFPAYATAPGKVLLAALPPEELDARLKELKLEAFTPNTVPSLEALREQLTLTRERGWAINDQEIFLGQRSISIPLTISGTQSAAILAATSVSQMPLDGLVSEFLPALRSTAEEIEKVASVLL
nr:IclR family transcriptional regulator C-terminal domain-containing protein [Sphingobium nicotianae]